MHMKGLSVLLTLALLVLAQQLSIYLKRAGSLPPVERATPSVSDAQLSGQLLARTNSRGQAPIQFPNFRAQNRFSRRGLVHSNESPNISFEL